MQDAMQLIKRFQQKTSIRDPKVDAWFMNQALYKEHGIAHPSLQKKSAPERRSRSPMLPGPRKVKSYDEELYDKWLAANYPIRSNTQLLFGDDFFDLREEPWGMASKGRPSWPSWVSDVLFGRSTERVGTVTDSKFHQEHAWWKPTIHDKEASGPVDAKWRVAYREIGLGEAKDDKRRDGRKIRHLHPES